MIEEDEEDLDVSQSLPVHLARQIVRRAIGERGALVVGDHAKQRMQKHNMKMPDIVAVLRGGQVQPGEWENGGWRYRVFTHRMTVVVEFESANEVFVVTCWRVTS